MSITKNGEYLTVVCDHCGDRFLSVDSTSHEAREAADAFGDWLCAYSDDDGLFSEDETARDYCAECHDAVYDDVCARCYGRDECDCYSATADL